ncbi:MAG: MotA/TolQ/ExbB proton channel family protein [Elusimicrobia bacterium]|nr:MotA/TolQ/ExbB proton channel family protein [Elusimicrobiota bacterium]
MEQMSFGQMLKVSITMPILLVLSILIVAQAIERFYVFWVACPLPGGFWEKVKAKLDKGDHEGALGICQVQSGIMGEALERLLNLKDPNTERLVEAFQLYRQRMHMELNRRLGFFGTASFIAPLIGLMGTVLGIMRAFHDLAIAGAGGPVVVAAGISEALVATAAGIGVAVMSAVFYNYFTLAARQRLSQADLWVFELAELLPQASPPIQAPMRPGPRLGP